uniref:Uncharacterized protein n=1 Tax=Calcidiscus leptoporus TaxID=127549 RepID=A0A7S0NVB7_9EUKA|mmetsp:Transcript_30153/g.70246  ORF Transcript_30153/g.70246 Transcript_30153/m.70246 type:complete len:284 (+) Transcript_30153:1-852(+)
MRGEAVEQEVAKAAWLALISEHCEIGDNQACELSVEAVRADPQAAAAAGSDPALPPPTPFLDTFATRGKGPSPQSSAKVAWMSRVAPTDAGATTTVAPASASGGVPPMRPPSAAVPREAPHSPMTAQAVRAVLPGRETVPGSAADAAAKAAAEADEEDCDVNPFLASSASSPSQSQRPPPPPPIAPLSRPPPPHVPAPPRTASRMPPGLQPSLRPQSGHGTSHTPRCLRREKPAAARDATAMAAVLPAARCAAPHSEAQSIADAAALATAELDEEDCDVNPFL